MSEARRTYVPAAGHDWALPFYDTFVALLGGNRARALLLEQARLLPGQLILDIGCGTGTFVVFLKRRQPQCEVIGLDPDPKALLRARAKAKRAGVAARFDEGYSDVMPYPDRSFDRVFSSFMFHHLAPKEQESTLREVRRVLKLGGQFHLMDFMMGNRGGFLARVVHSHQHVRDNSERRLLELFRDAGLIDGRKVAESQMMFGQAHLAYFSAAG